MSSSLSRAINYTRVFTEMGESLVETIVKTPNEVHHFLLLPHIEVKVVNG